MEKCACGYELKEKQFNDFSIVYCEKCSFHKNVYKVCTHQDKKIPIKVIISDGRTQVRLFCPICCKMDSKIEKQDHYDLNKLPTKNMTDYHNYRNRINESEKEEVQELLSKLYQGKYDILIDRYQKYLLSNEWRDIRKLALERDRYICQICNKVAEEVHHLTYAHLGHEYLFELVSLCQDCHETQYPSSFKSKIEENKEKCEF